MSIYVPDEQGELTALDGAIFSTGATQMPGDLSASFAKMFISLIVLVALLFITYWFLRKLIQNRLQKGTKGGTIQILEKRMISPKTMLYLVEVDNKKVLLAESHLEIKRLMDLEGGPLKEDEDR